MNRYRFDEENHLHLLDNKPLTGCSSIVGVLSKPLSWWASGKAVERLGWIHGNPKVNGKYKKTPIAERINSAKLIHEQIKVCSTAEYVALLDEAYKAHSVKLKESAGEGIDLHAELEKFVKWHMSGMKESLQTFPIQIVPFVDWTKQNVEQFYFSEGHCYSEPLWTGGIADFGARLKNKKNILGDFKSSKEAYTSHYIQGAGYITMIEENGYFDKDGNLLGKIDHFDEVVIFPFGGETLKPYVREANTFKEGFKNCTGLYRLIKSQEDN